MKGKILLLIVIFGVIAGISGCVTTGGNELSALNQRMVMLEERVYRLEQTMEGYKASAKNVADMGASIDALRTKVGQVQGKVEEHEQKLSAVSNQLAQIQDAAKKQQEKPSTPPLTAPAEQQKEQKAEPSPKPPEKPTEQPAGTTKQAAVSEKPQETPQKKPSEESPQQKPSSEKAMYEESLAAYNRKDYNASEKGFQEFLKKYPDSPLADDATFWLGEIQFTRGNLLKAIEHYQKVIDVYPKGNKVPMAMYKQGKAWEKLGDSTAAKILYEKVIKKYANTSEANLAKQALDELNKGSSKQ
ncbi:MAG: tol-pal system protein YbgF [Thermodesulforhabdaceae bacterium]